MGNLQGVLQIIVQLHYGRLITTPIAVVRSTEDGDDIALMTPIEALHDQLMRTADQGETVAVIELL